MCVDLAQWYASAYKLKVHSIVQMCGICKAEESDLLVSMSALTFFFVRYAYNMLISILNPQNL
jgi:hypothetical protein